MRGASKVGTPLPATAALQGADTCSFRQGQLSRPALLGKSPKDSQTEQHNEPAPTSAAGAAAGALQVQLGVGAAARQV